MVVWSWPIVKCERSVADINDKDVQRTFGGKSPMLPQLLGESIRSLVGLTGLIE